MSSSFETHGLARLDEHERLQHCYLTEDDHCWYLAEYRAGGGYRARGINRLIADLKCWPSAAASDPSRARQKRAAIAAWAGALRAAFSRRSVEQTTWIPIPPSRVRGRWDHDERLSDILRLAFGHYALDLRNLLYQAVSTPPDHCHLQRIPLGSLQDLIRLDPTMHDVRPRQRVILFDDLLTTGKHFKCCQRRLRERWPELRIDGLFLARRLLAQRGLPPRGPHIAHKIVDMLE